MPASTNPNHVVSYLTMRKAIGWLGMLLPFLLLAGNYILNDSDIFNNKLFVKIREDYRYEYLSSFKSSVSHYYYTTVGEIFTGTLFAVALFMFCYKGHPLRKGDWGLSDSAMANLAGIFALGVVMFPTSSEDFIQDNMRNFLSSDTIGYIHYAFAVGFFIALAVMSIINFRRAEKQELFGTGDDDPFFLRCGILMLGCLLLVPVFSGYLEAEYEWLEKIHSTFMLEAIALVAFGLSWLKKGKADLQYIPKKLRLAKGVKKK
jgi:small-conductance mechanosensitive channel